MQTLGPRGLGPCPRHLLEESIWFSFGVSAESAAGALEAPFEMHSSPLPRCITPFPQPQASPELPFLTTGSQGWPHLPGLPTPSLRFCFLPSGCPSSRKPSYLHS